jgi:Na+/melibiose symporter-like transporter
MDYASYFPPGLLMLALSVVIYLMPSIVAYDRKHQDHRKIFMVNVLFGWTIIGWLVALFCACTVVRRPPTDTRTTHTPAPAPLPERWRATKYETAGHHPRQKGTL